MSWDRGSGLCPSGPSPVLSYGDVNEKGKTAIQYAPTFNSKSQNALWPFHRRGLSWSEVACRERESESLDGHESPQLLVAELQEEWRMIPLARITHYPQIK